MATSYLDISSSNYTISVTSFSETGEEIIIEKTLIPNNVSYGNNTSLISGGNTRKKITISGHATLSVRGTINTALKANTLVKPYLYPFDEATNITASEYYYIKSVNGSYNLGNSLWFFTIELIYGGTY